MGLAGQGAGWTHPQGGRIGRPPRRRIRWSPGVGAGRLGGWELVGLAGGGQGGHQTLGGSGGGGAGKVFEEIYSDLRLREGHPSRGRVYKNFPAC